MDAEFDDSYWGDVSMRGILAHECAHLVQHRSPTYSVGKYIELEADFIAGYYLGVRRQKENFDTEALVESIFGKDDLEPDTTRRSHGSIDQRAECVRQGISAGYLNKVSGADEAFKKSRDVARRVTSH